MRFLRSNIAFFIENSLGGVIQKHHNAHTIVVMETAHIY